MPGPIQLVEHLKSIDDSILISFERPGRTHSRSVGADAVLSRDSRVCPVRPVVEDRVGGDGALAVRLANHN